MISLIKGQVLVQKIKFRYFRETQNRKTGWHQLYLRGVYAIVTEASDGAYGGLVVQPSSNETYSEYLNRIPTSAGLLAEYIASSLIRLPFLMRMHSVVAEAACALNICLEDFSGPLASCEATWRHALQTVGMPSSWIPSAASETALNSCPGSPLISGLGAKHHAPAAQTQQEGASSSNLPQLMNLLLDIDENVLNGKLLRMATIVKCHHSINYGNYSRLRPCRQVMI